MSGFILGKKLGCTQLWKDEKVVPVTLVEAGPATVTQVRTPKKDGYAAVQIGFDPSKKKINKAMKGHVKDLGNFRYVREFRMRDGKAIEQYSAGSVIDVSQFKEGERVKVSGLNKGRGFQGVVKRHGFSGGPKTHGQKDRLRAPGSIGATAPQRVMKHKKMAGRMGTERVSIKNLEIVAVNKEKNTIALKGSVPGMRGSLVEIQSAKDI